MSDPVLGHYQTRVPVAVIGPVVPLVARPPLGWDCSISPTIHQMTEDDGLAWNVGVTVN